MAMNIEIFGRVWHPNWHRTQPNRPDALDCADRKEPANQSFRCWPDRPARLQAHFKTAPFDRSKCWLTGGPQQPAR
jgi:hypothetical protein